MKKLVLKMSRLRRQNSAVGRVRVLESDGLNLHPDFINE